MKFFLIFLFLLCVVLALLFAGTQLDTDSFSTLFLPWMEMQTQGNLFFGALLFITLYALGALVLFPSALLTFAGGYLFGEYAGTLINLIGATTGASLCFLVCRAFAHHRLVELIRTKTSVKIPGGIKKLSSFWKVFILRLMPVVPFSGLNYGFGLTRISIRSFALGSFIGLLPKVAIGTFVGAAGHAYQSSLLDSWKDHRILLPLTGMVVLGIVSALIHAHYQYEEDR